MTRAEIDAKTSALSDPERVLLQLVQRYMRLVGIISTLVSIFVITILITILYILRNHEFAELRRSIDAGKCKCTTEHNVEAINTTIINADPISRMAREILQTQGKIKPDARPDRYDNL